MATASYPEQLVIWRDGMTQLGNRIQTTTTAVQELEAQLASVISQLTDASGDRREDLSYQWTELRNVHALAAAELAELVGRRNREIQQEPRRPR